MQNEDNRSKSAGRRGIQSVEIGMRVLQSVGQLAGPSTLSAIAQQCGMTPPQIHRYLQSLIASGMVRQDAGTGRYGLGPEALKIGLVALSRTDAFQLVDTQISDFVTRTGHNVLIAALGPLGPTITRWYSGTYRLLTSIALGAVLPLLQSANGRIFAAYSPPGEIEALLKIELRRLQVTKSEAIALLDQVRKEGKAHVSGSVLPGLNATAFPIFDLQGRPILSVAVLWSQLNNDPAEAELIELAEICSNISASLGWRGESGPVN